MENEGPSNITEAEVYILWPSSRESEEPLLYLTEQPLVKGNGHCQYVSDINPRDIKVGVLVLCCFFVFALIRPRSLQNVRKHKKR